MNLEYIVIDRNSHVPIAEQIANQLLNAIMDGDIEPEEKLPPERDLADALKVSRGTVKRAYAMLVESNAIDMRRGSGSYVLRNGHLLEKNQKRRAANTIAMAFSRLRDIGLSDKEIWNLSNLHYLSTSKRNKIRKMSIMVVSNNPDILSELEQQLSYLSESSPLMFTLSFLTIDTILGSPDPVQLLFGYDLVIATSIDYAAVVEIAPMFQKKIVEATLSPITHTLVELSTLEEESKIAVVYRTEVFRELVLSTLLSLDFKKENLYFYQEREYTPEMLGEHEVDAIVNFNESPVFIDPRFTDVAEAFQHQGGKIYRYEYQIERSSLLAIEDRLQRLLADLE